MMCSACFIHASDLGCKQHGWDVAEHGNTIDTHSAEETAYEGNNGKDE